MQLGATGQPVARSAPLQELYNAILGVGAPTNCPKLHTMLDKECELRAFPFDAQVSLSPRMSSVCYSIKPCFTYAR